MDEEITVNDQHYAFSRICGLEGRELDMEYIIRTKKNHQQLYLFYKGGEMVEN